MNKHKTQEKVYDQVGDAAYKAMGAARGKKVEAVYRPDGTPTILVSGKESPNINKLLGMSSTFKDAWDCVTAPRDSRGCVYTLRDDTLVRKGFFED